MDYREIFEFIMRKLDESGHDIPELHYDAKSEYTGEIVAVDPLTKIGCQITIKKRDFNNV